LLRITLKFNVELFKVFYSAITTQHMFLNVVLTRTSKQKFEKHKGQIKMRRDKKKDVKGKQNKKFKNIRTR